MKNKRFWLAIGILLVTGLAILLLYGTRKTFPSMGHNGTRKCKPAHSSKVATARSGTVDVIINALSTVTRSTPLPSNLG